MLCIYDLTRTKCPLPCGIRQLASNIQNGSIHKPELKAKGLFASLWVQTAKYS